jgi:hypothetical protein
MFIHRASNRASSVFAVASLILLTTFAYGQAPASLPPTNVENQVAEVRAENAELRERLRKMEEQQRALLERFDSLQRRLDGSTVAEASLAAKPLDPAQAVDAPVPSTAAAQAPVLSMAAAQNSGERYQDGMVIWQTPDDTKVPFLLKFNINTQFRYLNTLDSDDTFVDHLGNVREVHQRNDLTVNRSMFILGGYVFDRRLQYSFTAWTSAGAASIVLAGNVGWRFNKAIGITGGYTGVPGSRSLVNTFPFFAGVDRSMADNFFRPGFTQGLWVNGELPKGLNYYLFVGNGLNTLSISATKIDTNLLFSGSVWWEPLGAYGEPGKSRNMYDDYYASNRTRIRLGTAFTRSREDRFSNLDQSNPDNTSIYNSDGVLAFSTGAFAPGVTVDKALLRLWSIDSGIKRSGLAINGQYFMRWVNEFEADGPLPLASTFDHGGELSASYFAIPKRLGVYGRSSAVFGQFGNSWEYAGGVKLHFLPTERWWLQGELMRVNKVPYSGAFTPYTAGLTGWVPAIQTVLAF